jgi:hypothetical protein
VITLDPTQQTHDRRVTTAFLFEDGLIFSWTSSSPPDWAAARYDDLEEEDDPSLLDDAGTDYQLVAGRYLAHATGIGIVGFEPAPPEQATVLHLSLGGALIEIPLAGA